LRDTDGDIFHIYNAHKIELFEFETENLVFNSFWVGTSAMSNDVINLPGSGNDIVLGGGGNDTIFGNAGNDVLRGDDGDDHLHGGNGNDILVGGNGDDRLYGGSGRDRLDGNNASDVLTGGSDADVFVFHTQWDTGNDIITDFELGVDELEMRGLTFVELDFENTGSGSRVNWTNGSVELEGISISYLTEDQFTFI
ncbi:calcium-binding protein, partial [Ruegeria atlantica]|uniref:calcium-binding protein n=1 Tax=Ruegeria atlantica TaxID=81569 RepID=UPI0034A05AC8